MNETTRLSLTQENHGYAFSSQFGSDALKDREFTAEDAIDDTCGSVVGVRQVSLLASATEINTGLLGRDGIVGQN